MTAASGIRAGQAYVELLADDSKLRAGLASAQQQLSTWGSQIRHVGLAVFAAGAGMLAPLIAAAKQFASSGDALAKMAARTGMSVEMLSELKHAASVSGSSLEDLEHASRHLSTTITDAMKGSRSALDTLGGPRLAKQLAALDPDQQFLAVGKALAQIPDPARRAATAVAVFGRSGTMLLPLLEHMDALRDEAHQLGATMSRDQAQKAAALEDAWKQLEGATARITKALGAALAPALTRVARDILPVLVSIKDWISHNQAVVVTIAKVGAVLAAAGATIVTISGLITSAAWVFRALGMAVSAVTGSIGVLRAVMGGISTVCGFLTTNLFATSTAMRATAAATAFGSTAMAGARTGVLALALAFGRVRLAALTAFANVPGLMARVGAGAIAAAASLRGVTVRGDVGPQRVSHADRGRAVAGAGAQAAASMASGVGNTLRAVWAGIASLPGRTGGAFVTLGRLAVTALGSIRTAMAGLQVTASNLGSLVISGLGRAFTAIPVIAARAVTAIPTLIASAWGAVGGIVASGAGLVGRALIALPALAVSAGSALVAGIGSAIAALPGLFFGTIGIIATAVQAIPGLVMGGFALLRTALTALPGLFSAAFTALPALIGLAMNPVVLLGVAIVGLGVYLYETTDGGRQAMSQLGQAFAAVKDDAVTAFGAISDALSAGDIQGAVKILWAFIQLEWTRGIAAVENVMQAFAGGVAKIFLNVGFGINTAFWTAVYGIQNAIDWVVGGIVKVFSTVIGTIAAKIAYLLELIGVLDEGASDKIANLSKNINTGVDQVRAGRMAERDQKLADVKGLWDEKVAGVNDWMAEGMQGRDDEIAAKRKELDQAIADAQRARNTPDDTDTDTNTPARTGPPQKLVDDLSTGMNRAQLTVDAVGTFNATAISEMGIGGTAAERGLQAQEKTARFAERLTNAVESNPHEFT